MWFQMTKSNKSKTVKIDYTLEQFLIEVRRNRLIEQVLERMTNTLDRLDKRISKLEKNNAK